MNQQVISKIAKSKIGIFTIQVLILSFFILCFDYSFPIAFDSGITYERAIIIQFLGNYILVDTPIDAIFLFGIWTLAAMVPVGLLKNSRRAIGANLKLFFFPNFFFYLFLSRYSPKYFNSRWVILFMPFLIFAIILIIASWVIPQIRQKLETTESETRLRELRKVAEDNRTKCPNCGEKFDSSPTYCYQCSTRLIPEENKDSTSSS
jgi:uncharacterized membrane protein (DUF485 family)